jgi:hypothetical protein
MIQIDLPTMINKTLEISGRSSLIYIGHSQGTMMGFGGFPMMPELAAKVDLFIALAPVAFVTHVESLLLNFLAKSDLAWILDELGFKEFLPSNNFIHLMAGTLCKEVPFACEDVIFLLCGWDISNLNSTRMPFYMDHTPAGTSVRNMLHWTQGIDDKKFQMFDYGSDRKNNDNYGTPVPPQYRPFDMVKPPVAFFSGGQDVLADPQDVAYLLDLLPASNKPIYNNTQAAYEHLDFVWGLNAYQLIYPDVLNLVKQYSQW